MGSELPNGLAEELRRIHSLSRGDCIQELTHFRDIPLDFEKHYLEQMSVERLRHVLLAAVLTVKFRRKAG